MAQTLPSFIIIEEGAIRNDHEDLSCLILLKRGKDSLAEREREREKGLEIIRGEQGPIL